LDEKVVSQPKKEMFKYNEIDNPNESEYDDGGFLSDEFDENKSAITPRKSNVDDKSLNMDQSANGIMNISRISRFGNHR